MCVSQSALGFLIQSKLSHHHISTSLRPSMCSSVKLRPVGLLSPNLTMHWDLSPHSCCSAGNNGGCDAKQTDSDQTDFVYDGETTASEVGPVMELTVRQHSCMSAPRQG